MNNKIFNLIAKNLQDAFNLPKYYCETTESLICYDCTIMGPNNTQMHRISVLDDAYRYRFETLNKAIIQTLAPK
jgi:palmitoyltransferase